MFDQILDKCDSFEDTFIKVAESKGVIRDECIELLQDIPFYVKRADAYFDKMTNKYRYHFGRPYHTNNQVMIGTDQLVNFEELIDTAIMINKVLSPEKKRLYYRNLNNRDKHREILSEAIPLLFLKNEVETDYEVPSGVGNKTVDWSLKGQDFAMLLEVKYRLKELVNKIDSLGRPTPESLFPSTQEKFISQNKVLQGVWIVTAVKYSKKELKKEYRSLDKSKIHFVILSNWDSNYCITNNCKVYKQLKRIFNLTKSKSIVY